MKIGLYFGSFNPIHHGHLILASYIEQHTLLDRIWFIVSPQNPFKSSASLLNEYHRLHLVNISIEDDARFKAMDIEFKMPRPSYTADTLAYIGDKYPEHEFSVVMGSDSFENLHKWKNHHYIINNHALYVYSREGHDMPAQYAESVIFLPDVPLLPISSTHIRKMIREGQSIRYLVPEAVRNEIESGVYYQ
jgi:nicotinate-nucleotide adenylyltransferase